MTLDPLSHTTTVYRPFTYNIQPYNLYLIYQYNDNHKHKCITMQTSYPKPLILDILNQIYDLNSTIFTS